jgi:hypothetical protein
MVPTMEFEFVDGPKDGERMVLPAAIYEHRISLITRNMVQWYEPTDPIPYTAHIRVGIYRRSALLRHRGKLFWKGEE